ncbi:hypothetical protein ACIP97_03495 [Peribacillus frigoritolerans]|uniref:hypothetical protein n=1 Tax=Peribacillus frigoritolerans TaxID=450367 RepID=UPI0038009D0A
MERKVRDSCGKSESKGDPAGAKRRGGSRTARGKRVPGVEINGSSFTNQKNCSQTRFSSSSSAVCNRFNVRLNRHS